MKTYYFICDKERKIANEYMKHRPELKDLSKMSRNGVTAKNYPDFAIFGIRLHNEMYEMLLDEFLESLDTAMHIKYGIAYEEFITYCRMENKLYGTETFDKIIIF